MIYTRTTGLLKETSTVIFIHFAFKRENGKFLDQGHQGLKISCFSCVIQPIEIVYKSVNNGPTFTKLDSFVAKYVCYENQLRYGPFLNIQTF